MKSAVLTEKASIMRTKFSSSFSAKHIHVMIRCAAAVPVTISPSVSCAGRLGLLIW